MQEFKFNPEDGLKNVIQFVDEPLDPRSDIQGMFDQIKDYLNNNGVYADVNASIGVLRQAIINGNFDIWQRGTSITNPANGFLADRWGIAYSADGGVFPTSIAHGRIIVNDVPSSYYAYRITTNGAGSGFGANLNYCIYERIENGTRLLGGANNKITISFYARSSIANKKLGISVSQRYGTGGSPSANDGLGGQVINLTSAWTKYTLTVNTSTLIGKTFGTNNDDYIQIRFDVAWGTTYGATLGLSGSSDFVGSGYIDIAQVQICAGDVALPFQPKKIFEEIKESERSFEKSYALDVVPGTASSTNGLCAMYISGSVPNGAGLAYVPFKTRKRTTPTVKVYAYDGTADKVNIAGGNIAVNITAGETGFYVVNNSGGAVSGSLLFHFTAEIEL